MSGRRLVVLALVLSGALLTVSPAYPGGKPGKGKPDGAPTDQLIVHPADGQTLDAASLAATAGVDLKKVRKLADGSVVVKLPKRASLDDVNAISARLDTRSDVALAEADEMLQPLATAPNDTFWSSQWDMRAPVAGSYGIDLLGAWDVSKGDVGVRVGVIDTGYLQHADLNGRFVPGYDFIGDTFVSNDKDGRDADASDPGDWVTSGESAANPGCGVSDSSWHGTHVSGTIGAIANNSAGVAGINQVSQIQPLRVLGKCGGYLSDIADAIRWGAGLHVNGIDDNTTPDRVLNLSLGGSGACGTTLQSAIDAATAAGTVVVVAAGNSNANASNFQPANCNNVITVAATGPTGKKAYYSNFGSTVEIAAPGGDSTVGSTILSTLNAGATVPTTDTYEYYQGTSMATPHVTGIVSLMLSANQSLTPAQVTQLLRSTATPFPAGSTCTTTTCGSGIANAAAAVAAAKGGSAPAPGPFSKSSPANGATNQNKSVKLTWGASTGASSYEVCLSTSSTCTSSTSVGAATSATANVSSKKTYWWQVRAKNTVGTTTLANGGTAWSFKTR